MLNTTKIKILSKKYLPNCLFEVLKFTNSHFFSKARDARFNLSVKNFKQRQNVSLSYGDINFRLVIDPKNGYLDKQIYSYHKYEEHIVDEIINALKPGNRAVDIGANIGHHTMVMSKCVGEKGEVYAFEPIPGIRDQLNESIKINDFKNIKVFPYALGDENKTENLSIASNNIGSSSIIPAHVDSNTRKITIEVKRLDDIIDNKIDFIKIDVEGYEYFTLMGSIETIKKYSPAILIEFSPLYYQANNESHSLKILELFDKLEYRIYDLENNKEEVTQFQDFINTFSTEGRPQTNLLCIPKK